MNFKSGICGAPDPSDETTTFILLYIPSIKLPSKFIFLPIDQWRSPSPPEKFVQKKVLNGETRNWSKCRQRMYVCGMLTHSWYHTLPPKAQDPHGLGGRWSKSRKLGRTREKLTFRRDQNYSRELAVAVAVFAQLSQSTFLRGVGRGLWLPHPQLRSCLLLVADGVQGESVYL